MTTQMCWGTVFRKRRLLFPAADPGAKRELSKTPQRFCLPAPQPARRRGSARLHLALSSRRSDAAEAAAVESCGAVRLARQPAVRDAVRRCLCQAPDCSDQAHFGLQPPKMKTPMRHGVAAFLLITMCTSLLFVYNISTSKEHNDAGSRHRQKPTGAYSRSPRAPRTPALQGYGSIIDHRPLNMHCRNCALVTSSGQLIGGGRGREIDSAECVIRMNDAPTQDYQRDVGGRTSLRVVAHSSMQRVLHGRRELLNGSRDTVFIFWGPSAYMRRDGKGLVYNNLRLVKQVLPELRVYIISRQKMLQFDELFKRETGKDRRMSNSWLSTGWFTVAIALELCDRINIYGMVSPDHCREPLHPSVPYHYYEPAGTDECTMYVSHEGGRRGSHHRFLTEKRVFASWACIFDIHFHQPEWSPEPPPASNWTVPRPA